MIVMKKVKLTKTELKVQKDHLKRYNRYLPILNIKKRQLQKEIFRIRLEIKRLEDDFNRVMSKMAESVSLLGEDVGLSGLICLKKVETRNDNIAGVDIPVFVNADLDIKRYDIFVYPLWVDWAVSLIGKLITIKAHISILKEQELLLSREFRITYQRVNLFEKVKIPEAKETIKRITVCLGDQQTAAVGWARMAKKKIQRAVS